MGKRLNIELGQRGVNSGQKFSSRFLELPGLSVLHFYVFSDFPSSEVKYTGLESRGKGCEKIPNSHPTGLPQLLCQQGTRAGVEGSDSRAFAFPSPDPFPSGDDRDRTGNPCLAKAVLSQLSYVPVGHQWAAEDSNF